MYTFYCTVSFEAHCIYMQIPIHRYISYTINILPALVQYCTVYIPSTIVIHSHISPSVNFQDDFMMI